MGIAPGSLLLEYRESQKLAAKDYSFYGLIMAAMRRADTRNLEILQNAWPKVYEALACGGFVICDNQRDVKRLFKDGEHLVIFQGAKDRPGRCIVLPMLRRLWAKHSVEFRDSACRPAASRP